MASTTIAVDYTSKDYDGFRASLLDYASRVFPEWKGRSEGDFGVLMVEMFAYLGDILSFYGDRIQQESYLSSASQRLSLLQIADLLGYTPSNGVPASGTVTFQTNNPQVPVTIPAGTQVATDYLADIDGPVLYETQADVIVPANGGTVVATVVEGSTRTLDKIGVSSGLADQTFRLPYTPVIDGSVRVFVESVGDPEEWVPLQYLVDANPEDKAFSVHSDAEGATWILLGDGTSGLIPATGLNIYATYRVGGGSAGNRLAGTITQIVQAIPGVFLKTDVNGVSLSSAMTGGADPESVEQIRRNAPLAFRTQQRLVTLQDFEDAALAIPGVSKAAVMANHYTSVVVYITGPNGTTPNQALKDSVQTALTARALAGVTVTVAAPSVIKVNVGSVTYPVTITAKARHHRTIVQNDVLKALQKMLAVESTDFGMRVSLSDVYAAISEVEGVQWVNIPMFARTDAAQTGTADIQFRTWEIPTPGNIVLSVSGGIG